MLKKNTVSDPIEGTGKNEELAQWNELRKWWREDEQWGSDWCWEIVGEKWKILFYH